MPGHTKQRDSSPSSVIGIPYRTFERGGHFDEDLVHPMLHVPSRKSERDLPRPG
jgi:hypothetical protein